MLFLHSHSSANHVPRYPCRIQTICVQCFLLCFIISSISHNKMQPHKTPMVLVSISSTSQYPRFVTYWLSSVKTEQTPPSTTHFHIGRSRRKQSGARIPKGTVIRIFSIKNAWVTTLYPHVENSSRFMPPFLEPGSLEKKVICITTSI